MVYKASDTKAMGMTWKRAFTPQPSFSTKRRHAPASGEQRQRAERPGGAPPRGREMCRRHLSGPPGWPTAPSVPEASRPPAPVLTERAPCGQSQRGERCPLTPPRGPVAARVQGAGPLEPRILPQRLFIAPRMTGAPSRACGSCQTH